MAPRARLATDAVSDERGPRECCPPELLLGVARDANGIEPSGPSRARCTGTASRLLQLHSNKGCVIDDTELTEFQDMEDRVRGPDGSSAKNRPKLGFDELPLWFSGRESQFPRLRSGICCSANQLDAQRASYINEDTLPGGGIGSHCGQQGSGCALTLRLPSATEEERE